MSNQINLVNPAYQVNRQRLNAAVMLGATAAVYLGFVVANILQQGTLAPLRERLASVEGQLEGSKIELEKAIAGSKKREPNKQLADEVKRLETRLDMERELLVALETGGIGNTEGFSKYLTALARRRVEGVWLTGLAINASDSRVSLAGLMNALDLLPVYMRELKADETLRGQKFGTLEVSNTQIDMPSPASKPARNASDPVPAPGAPAEKATVVQFKLGSSGGGER